MPKKKRAEATILSPSMLSLVRQIGKTRQEIAKLKKNLKEIADLQKRKVSQSKNPLSFLEVLRKYAALERKALKITRSIFKNGR